MPRSLEDLVHYNANGNEGRASSRIFPLVLLATLLGAAGLAVFSPRSEGAARANAPAPAAEHPSAALPVPRGEPELAGAGDFGADLLPPNHPPVEGAPQAVLPGAAGRGDGPGIAWKVPALWRPAPNPNAMRLATYRAPASPKGNEPADVSVTRAGGTADANIERWLGQFDDAGAETRTVKTVRGFKVTMVEVSGTFTGGSMTPGVAEAPRRGWALLGAIVETPGSPYFFKLTGEAATVRSARPSFIALVDSITPS